MRRGVDAARRLGERGLVLPQVFLGDGEQLVDRERDHLVGGELLAKRLFADGEITVRALQQVILQPFLVVVERGDDGVVRLLELGEECLVGHGGEGGCDRGAEEVAIAVDLLDRDLGVDTRRVVQVLACFGERGGHGLLARNQAAQALLGGRERALDHQVGGVGEATAVAVRIPRPRPNGFERQDARVDRQEQLLAIELVGGRQSRGIGCSGALPELTRGRDLVEHCLTGRIPDHIVVLVDTEERCERWLAAICVLEIAARDLGERGIARWLGRRRGGRAACG